MEYGFELPRGIDTPRVEELPRGNKTSGVTPKGDGFPGADGRGRGGGRNSPITLETEASRDSSSGKEMAIGMGPSAGIFSKVLMHRHPDGADGTSPK